MQFRTEEDFVMSLLRLCGTDWAVMETSKGALSQFLKCHLEIPLCGRDVSQDAAFTLVSDFVLSPNCISISYVT